MSGIGEHKLRDSVPEPNEAERDKPAPPFDAIAEQTREKQESTEAQDAKATNRERMVNIGRGNQQAGRQGQ